MNRLLLAAALLATPTVSFADGPSTAVVVAGDCQSFDLTRAASEFTEALKQQPEVQVVDFDAALPKLGREASRSVEEVQRQLTVAEDHYYRGQHAKMVERLEVAINEIRRLPPGRARWQLYAAAWNLEALARSRMKKRGTIEEAYRHILRLDSGYKLDPDYVAPSMIKLFEQTRRTLAAEPKHRVTITTHPTGAKIYVDGKEFTGKTTPATIELPTGTYSIQVGKNERLSFPRDIEVGATKDLFVDLGFEGAVEAGRALCLAMQDEQKRLEAASRLGSLLDADQVVMIRRDQANEHPAWLTATAVIGSAKVREGGLEVHATEGIRPAAMTALARFIATGEGSGVVRSPPKPQEVLARPTAAPSPATQPSKPTAPPFVQETHDEPAASRPFTRRMAGVATLGTGGAVAAAGAVFLVLSANENARVAKLRDGGIPDHRADEVRAMIDSAALKQTIGFAGIGAGALAAGAGAYLFLSSPTPPTGPPTVSLLPTREGGFLSVHGTLPW